MPQKIDVHGLFIDPMSITGLSLQKRISIYYPVFYEVAQSKSIFRHTIPDQHILEFHSMDPYGIVLADIEQPDPASYVVNYQEAAIERFLRGLGKAGKNFTGHINEMLKIEVSGDRQYRILQSGRNVKQTSIREIPAKVKLLSGQWVDVFKSSPGYDFKGGTPYAITDVDAHALMITTKDRNYVLYGAGVDAKNEDVMSAYHSLTKVYNEIQSKMEMAKDEQSKKPLIQMPQINIQIPRVELPQIKFQSPFVLGKKGENEEEKALPPADSHDES